MTPSTRCPRCGGPLTSDVPEAPGVCPWCPTQSIDVSGSAAPSSSSPVGDAWKRFGKYFLTEKLGRGGMGEVWKALDGGLGRSVALKFLKTDDEAELARFRREAQTAASLSHPHIASIYEVGEIDGRHYIAMQYVKGRTLGRFPREDRKLLIRLVRDAARAVAYANQQGIIHRDLKPENVMAMEVPGGWQVFVLDFGLARPIEEGQTVSKSGTVMGTPAYMSPEQARGDKLDERTDVYSLGATLYELLSGKLPFVGANSYEVVAKVLQEEPVPPRRHNPKIHEDLETIILKCLEKDRERRYASAQELASDLDRFLEGEPIQARPASALYRTLKFIAKRRGAAMAAMLFVALALGGVYFLIDRGRTASYQAALQKGRDTWEDVVKAVTAVQTDRAKALAAAALGHFDEAARLAETGEALVLRGRCLQILGRSEEATAAWRRALAVDPDNAEARYQSAKVLLLAYQKSRGTPPFQPYVTGTEAEAPPILLEELRSETEEEARQRDEAEALLAGYAGAREKGDLLRGLLAMGRGQFPEAAEHLSKYTQIEPWDAPAMRLEAISWYYAGRYDRAGQALDRLLAAGPDAHAYLWRGIVNLRKRNYEAARFDSTKAIQIDGGLAWAYQNRARAKRSLGEVDESLEDLAKSVELDPGSVMTYADRAYVRFTWRGDYEGALSDASRAIELNPRSGYAHQVRASIRMAQGDLDGVLSDATRALELDPRRDSALAQLVAVLLVKGDLEGALRAAETAVEGHPTSEADRALGAAREAAGDVRGALEALNRSIETEPSSYRAYLDRARLKRDSGDRAGAAEDFARALSEVDKAFERRRRDARGALRRALVREDMGNYAGAIEDCGRALELDPRHGPAYQARAAVKLATGEYDGAIQDLAKTLQENRTLHLQKGVARLGKGDVDGALSDFSRAIGPSEGTALGYFERALAYYSKGSWPECVADLRAASSQGGLRERDKVRLLLWVARARGGDRPGADEELAASFRDRPSSPPRAWYGGVADFLLGRVDESKLVASEEGAGGSLAERHCEANFYIGAKALIDGNRVRADLHFGKCLQTSGRRDLPEFLAATADVRTLQAPK